MAGAVPDLILRISGPDRLSEPLPVTALCLGFSAEAGRISIDPETGKVRISLQALEKGLAGTLKMSGASGEDLGQVDLRIRFEDINPGSPELP